MHEIIYKNSKINIWDYESLRENLISDVLYISLAGPNITLINNKMFDKYILEYNSVFEKIIIFKCYDDLDHQRRNIYKLFEMTKNNFLIIIDENIYILKNKDMDDFVQIANKNDPNILLNFIKLKLLS